MGVPFFRRTFRITRFRPDVPRDVAEEIDLHLDLRTEELIEQGMAPREARRRAEAAFGDRGGIEDKCRRIGEPLARARRRLEIFSSILGNARRSSRDLWRRPAFAVAACLTLAVCIAGNTAVFSVVHSIVFAPLPYPDSERLVTLFNSFPKVGHPRTGNSVPEYLDRRQAVAALEEVALYQTLTCTMGEPGSVRRVSSMIVTPSFFGVLGVEPRLGRTFTEDETEPGAGKPAVISFGLWQELFAGNSAAVGRELRVDGVNHTVVGVMPEGFSFPGWSARLWLPVTLTEEQKSDRGRYGPFLQMLARLRPGATIAQAKTQVDAWNERLLDEGPADYARLIDQAGGFDTRIVGFRDDLVRDVEPWLYLLLGGALFVLVIGGVSLANMLLVRATSRLPELATRYLLGAGRARLLRQLLTESLVLALLGGGLGILAGVFCLRWVDVFKAYEIPRVSEVGLAPWAAGLMLGLAVSVMIVATLVAAFFVGRRDLHSILSAGVPTPGRGPSFLGALAAAQIAVACILLIGAALMGVSLWNLRAIDPGFGPENVLVASLNLPAARYEKREDQHRFLGAVLAEIRSLPGVKAAALATQVPLDDVGERFALTAEGVPIEPGEDPVPYARTVISPDFFSALGIPLVAGRTFRHSDDGTSPPAVVVSEAVAKRHWDGVDNALGQRARLYLDLEPVDEERGVEIEWHTVVGVVGDVAHHDLADRSRTGAYYVSYRQNGRTFVRLVIKTEREPLALTPAVRDRVSVLDPEIVVYWVDTLEGTIESSLFHLRIPMQLLLIFAAVALLLAALGVHGVLAQAVAQRTKEICIRMALGGSLQQIYRRVLRSTLVFVATGLGIGLAGALPFTRLMAARLYGVRPTDPMVFLAVGAVIVAVALLAATLPVRRATRIDPIRVLTSE